jgi:hypothetical protein
MAAGVSLILAAGTGFRNWRPRQEGLFVDASLLDQVVYQPHAIFRRQLVDDHAQEAQRHQLILDGRGRALDNIFIERLWRSVKYERIYLMSYATGSDLRAGLMDYFDFYNTERPHQSLEYRTPKEVHCG